MRSFKGPFYPSALRPKGLCRCLRLSVRLSVSPSVHFWLVCAITRQVFNLSSPNLHQLCILSTYRLLSKMGSIDLDLPGHSGRGVLQRPTLLLFLYEVTHRIDDTALRLQDEITADEEDFLSYGPLCHAKCRNAYTNKKTVAQKMKSHVSNTSEETATTDVGSCSVRPRRGSSATGYIDHKTQCFICRRERTSKGDHKLLLVSMADRQNSIWKKAKDLQDENMLYHIHGFGDNYRHGG